MVLLGEYDSKTLQDADEIANNYRILEKTNNLMAIFLPPNKTAGSSGET